MKNRITMREIYRQVANGFADRGEHYPTHCDVRCTVNDALDHHSKDGRAVRWDYSQDAAWRAVRRMLCTDF